MPHLPRLSTLFSQIAPRYDLLNHVLSLNIDRSWRRKLVRRAGVQPGNRILDVCAGSGDVAVEFAEHEADVRIVGLDFSYEMLAIAQRKARSQGHHQRTHVVLGDAFALPFDDATFDLVTIAFGLRNLHDRGRGISEMARVLKRGGRLLILEFLPPPRSPIGRLYAVYLDRLLPLIGGVISGAPHAYRYLATSIGSFLSADQVLALMADAGLQNVVADGLTCGVAGLHVGQK